MDILHNFITTIQDGGISTGRLFLLLGCVWFFMAFITGKRRQSISIYLYLVIGLIFFSSGLYGMVYGIATADTLPIKQIVILIEIVVLAILIIFMGWITKTGELSEILHGKSKEDDKTTTMTENLTSTEKPETQTNHDSDTEGLE